MNELTIPTLTERKLTQNQNMGSLLNRFESYLEVSEVTRKSYMVALQCFAEWTNENGINQPQRADILRYVKYLSEPHARRQRKDRGHSGGTTEIVFSAGTQARYLRAVKLFFKWMQSEGLYPDVCSNIHGAKVRADNTKRDALQKADAVRLLDSIDHSTPAGLRDYAMILLSITGGLRIIEMQRANIGDIETIAGEHVLFVQGKGHSEKDAYKKLCPEVYDAIMEYIKTREEIDATAPLFAGIGNRSKGQRLTEPSISRIIKTRLRTAGYDTHRLSAHSLRHTSVTFLLESGATLQEAQIHARHADPATTGIYAHNIQQQKSHTEQRIYNYLFDKQADPATQAADYFRKMTAAQQAKALELLQAIAG